jgi:hypothetical protein
MHFLHSCYAVNLPAHMQLICSSYDKIHNVYISFLATVAIYNGQHSTREVPYFLLSNNSDHNQLPLNSLESLSSRLGTLVVGARVHDPQLAHGAYSSLTVCRVEYGRRANGSRNRDRHRGTIPPQGVVEVGGRSSRSAARRRSSNGHRQRTSSTS